MRFGFVVPYAEALDFAEIAGLAESRGWDGVFTWEALWGVHAWVTLGAASMTTSRVRLGTMLTPAARWKPWDLASAVLTVDRLSGGRAVLSVGLGAVRRKELGLAEAAYDVIVEADSSGEFVQLDPPTPAVWAEAGATWWIESWWSLPRGPDGLAELKRRVQAGPPRG